MHENFNDGSRNAPRLRFGQALWGMLQLPLNQQADGLPEWTLDEKFTRCREAGFEVVECWLEDDNEREVRDALSRHGLKLVLGHRAYSPEDVRATFERAQRLDADFVFLHPADAYTPLEKVVAIVREGQRLARESGRPFFVETHRGNFTETIRQTEELIAAIPEVRITGDFSHFVVGGEFYGWKEENAIGRMEKIWPRVAHLHARISNGEAVQVDVGEVSSDDLSENLPAQFFVEIWAEAMRHWLQSAQPGDVLQFSSELGPPRYAMTLPDGREFSDRWAQALVMKKLGEIAWQKAQR